MNDANLLQCQNLLDQIDREHKEGEPACLVTISSHAKKFCTGQDTALWGEKGMIGPLQGLAENWVTNNKLMNLGMPTMAVLNGHTYAAGAFFALSHEFRTMIHPETNPRARFCISE